MTKTLDSANDELRPATQAEAKWHGAFRYFTGRPCRRGHIAERFAANNSCVECALIQLQNHKKRDPESSRRRAESHRKRHGKHLADRKKRWKAENPQKVLASRQKHAAAAVARVSRWRKENPDKFSELAAICSQNRRAKLVEASGAGFTAEDVRKIYRHQKGKCWWCPKPLGKKFHRDHRFPLAKDGDHDPANIVLTCPTCNLKKGSKMPWEFAGRLL